MRQGLCMRAMGHAPFLTPTEPMRGKPFFNQTELAIEIHYKPKKEKFNFSGNILKNPVKIWRKSES